MARDARISLPPCGGSHGRSGGHRGRSPEHPDGNGTAGRTHDFHPWPGGELMGGSVKVVSEGPIGGVLRYALPGIGVTGVGASPPVQDALFPVRQEGGLDTAAAIRNLNGSDLVVTCRLMKDGAVLEETEIPLAANGQEARYIEEIFTRTDTSDFVGSVRCTAPAGREGRFTGVAVELDESNQIFTTVPVVPVQR